MSGNVIEQAADRIRQAFESHIPCAPVRELLPPADLEAAYAVQSINTNRWMTEGRRLVGRKIGLTAKSVQKQLGVDQPDYGMLFADMAYGDDQEIPFGQVMQPRVEAEVAFVLEQDLLLERPTLAEVTSAVAYALPAIEVVGSRIANWDINIVDTIADNASSGLFVLGATPCRLSSFELELCGMVMECRGDQISLGSGKACLGNPLNAARWLAEVMVRVGNPLRAGDIILSGALGSMVAANPGDVIEARINRLGSVRAVFAKELQP